MKLISGGDIKVTLVVVLAIVAVIVSWRMGYGQGWQEGCDAAVDYHRLYTHSTLDQTFWCDHHEHQVKGGIGP
jgi:hypothetical protein